jgi:hypothetical protein
MNKMGIITFDKRLECIHEDLCHNHLKYSAMHPVFEPIINYSLGKDIYYDKVYLDLNDYESSIRFCCKKL